MRFQCNGCGACCRQAERLWANIKQDYPEMEIPTHTNPDGSCTKLVGNRCSIYEDRPLACRVDDFWKAKLRHQGIKKITFHAASYFSCQDLQKAEGQAPMSLPQGLQQWLKN